MVDKFLEVHGKTGSGNCGDQSSEDTEAIWLNPMERVGFDQDLFEIKGGLQPFAQKSCW